MEEVDAVATRVDVAARQLDSLRQTSVLEDCFHIWCAHGNCWDVRRLRSPSSRELQGALHRWLVHSSVSVNMVFMTVPLRSPEQLCDTAVDTRFRSLKTSLRVVCWRWSLQVEVHKVAPWLHVC